MTHRYDIAKMLLSYIGYKGLPYPGAYLGMLKPNSIKSPQYEGDIASNAEQEFTTRGTRLRSGDQLGRWYFMPVAFVANGKYYNVPHAVVNIVGKKTIIETPMVGRKGSVKELISIEDYKVSIAGYIQSVDTSYPEEQINDLMELYRLNQSVDLVCALTDLVFDDGDQVVITDISLPETPGVENGQIVRIECVTDRPFDLIIN